MLPNLRVSIARKLHCLRGLHWNVWHVCKATTKAELHTAQHYPKTPPKQATKTPQSQRRNAAKTHETETAKAETMGGNPGLHPGANFQD